MKKKIRFFVVFSVFFCGQVFSQKSDGIVPDYWKGAIYNGVCWAESNVDKPGTFVGNPEEFGRFYQWKASTGWIATNFLTGDDTIISAKDPCPAGWRLPSVEEAKTLVLRHYFAWGDNLICLYDGKDNLWFPVVGYLSGNCTTPVPRYGYWSGSVEMNDAANAWMFSFVADRTIIHKTLLAPRDYPFLIRCVADEKCDSIVSHDTVTICSTDLPYEWRNTTFGEETQTGTYRISRRSCAYTDIAYLHLTVQEENEKSCPGVLINEVCWAESNVDEPGTFAAAPEASGMYYQWNRKKGWPAEKPGAEWDETSAPGERWEPENDPCPKGWRVPTAEEMQTLLNSGKVASISTQRNGIEGIEFTYVYTGTTLFFPLSSSLYSGGLSAVGSGYYWSGSSSGNGRAKYLLLGRNNWATFSSFLNFFGFTVRCVYDWHCDTIITDTSVTVCAKDLPYTWGNTTFDVGTVSGVYRFQHISAVTGCDSIVNLHLTVDKCEKPCPGVLINGVCWAESNVDEPGTFAATPEAWGMLYQWNRRKGWSATESVSGWDSSLPSGSCWDAANDPCPTGWRVPIREEFDALLDNTNVTCIVTSQNGVGGRKFTDNATGSSIFLPGVNYREDNNAISHPGSHGWYWSSSSSSSMFASSLFFTALKIAPLNWLKNFGIAIRCVVGDPPDCGSIVTDTSLTVCTNDLPYEWGDTTFDVGTVSGVYRFQYISVVTGCDSIVTLHLTIQQPFDTTFYDTVCQGTSYNRYGFSLSDVLKDYTYTLPLSSRAGCDSTLTLHLKVHPVYDTTLYDTICQGDDYTNHGFNLPAGTAGGTFTETYTTVHGCDSVVTLHLHVHPSHSFSETHHICQGDTITFHDRQLYKSGVYYDSLTTVHGCDSIYSMTLTVHPVYAFSFSGAVCQGNGYYEYGFNLPAVYGDTIVRDTFKTRWGCDSIRILSLSVHPVYETSLYDTICQGDDYNRHGFSLSNVQTDAVYTLSLSSRAGCDSTLILHLKVHPVYNTTLYDSICPSAHYERYGFRLSNLHESGTYRRTLPTVHGCDSTVTLHLHVWPTYFYPETVHLCEGDTFDFRGRRYHESGIYYDSLSTSTGCDSIYCLYLSVHPVYDLHLSGVLCEGSPYTQNGFHATIPGTHYRYLQSTFGCDSTITLTLTEEKKITGAISLLLEDCSLHGYSFFFEPGDQISRYQWNLGDGTVLRTEEGYHQYADSGTYRIQLHTETYNDCENDFSYVQHVPPYLREVQIHADRQVIDEDYPTVRFHAVVLPGMTCRWDFGDGVTATGDSVSHTYNATTEPYYDVRLQILNSDSCVTESGLRIEVVFLPKTTNTFSPNGDGINDIFMPDYRIEIIDRNGLRIFTGESGWDGTYKGREAKEDTYFYLLHYRTANGERQKTGYVTLIR